MKRFIYFFALLVICFDVYSQQSVILRNNRPVDPQKVLLKKGDSVTIIINDINTFLYDVKIASKSISYTFEELPDIFKEQLGSENGLTSTEKSTHLELYPERDLQEMSSIVTSIEVSINKIKKIDQIINELKLLVETENPLNINTIEAERNQIVNNILMTNDCEESVNCRMSIYRYFTDAMSEFKTNVAYYNNVYSQTKNAFSLENREKAFHNYQKINSLSSAIDENSFDKKLNTLLKLYDRINPKAFSAEHSIVVGKKSNEIMISYEWSAKKNLQFVSLPEGTFRDSLSFIVNKKLAIDFSTGVFLTWLKDYEYSTTPKDTENGTVEQISLKSSSKMEFATGALLHVYSQWWKYINLTLSSGIALNGDNKPRYLIGGGLILGRKRRIILNGGRAFGETERLSEHQAIGQTVESFDEVQTVSTTKDSWFFALTYNF